MNTIKPEITATDILAKAQAIKLLILDVDGVLTDGKIYLDEQGHEQKTFSIRDGLGIVFLQRHGCQVAIITGRDYAIISHRAKQLKIAHLYHGNTHKLPAYLELIAKLGLSAHEVAHVGDDLPDLALFKQVGLAIAVADAHPEVIARADWCTQAKGGHGAVREVCDLILQAQGHLQAQIDEYWHAS